MAVTMDTAWIIDNLKTNGEICPITDAKTVRLTFEIKKGRDHNDAIRFFAEGRTEREKMVFRVPIEAGRQEAYVSAGEAREKVFWRVRGYENGKLVAESEESCFERGLLGKFCSGRWIELSSYRGKLPLFQKTFCVRGALARARLYVTGLGYYVSYLNGTRTDALYLKPLVSEYDERPLDNILCYAVQQPKRRIYYNAFDVLPFLKEGENVLSVLLGNGWYHHKEKSVEGDYSYGIPKTLFELHLEYADGTSEIVASDETCCVYETEREATLFRGERVDFREKSDLTKLIAKDRADICKKIPTGKLCAAPACGDYAANCILPVASYYFENSVTLDFGKNHAGNLSIKISGIRGAHVRVVYGEKMTPDRHVDHYSSSWGVLIQNDRLILSGEEDRFAAEFTVHAYRYAEIVWDSPCKILSVVSQETHSYVGEPSKFTCSDRQLERLADVCTQTFVSNMHGGIPSDCPHRERRGYTGDGQITCEAVFYAVEAEVFYRKWLKDIEDAQDGVTGFVPHTAPFSGGGGGPSWGYAICAVPEILYRHTGDKKIVKEALPHVRRWTKYLKTRMNAEGLIDREERDWCLGEWFCPERVLIPPEFVNTLVYIKSLRRQQKFSRLSGERENVTQEIEAAADAVNRAFLAADGNYCGNVQGANLFALDAGVVPLSLRETCWQNCVEHYSEDTLFHVDTGIFGTEILFRMLFERHRADIALKILQKTDYPSYGYMLKQGATTLWECWSEDVSPDYVDAAGTLNKGYPVSHNHPMFGSVLAVMYRFVAGLDIGEIGSAKKIRVSPLCCKLLDNASASVRTVYGEAAIAWERKEENLNLFLRIPTGCYAEFDEGFRGQWLYEGGNLPKRLQGGEYTIKFLKKERAANGI